MNRYNNYSKGNKVIIYGITTLLFGGFFLSFNANIGFKRNLKSFLAVSGTMSVSKSSVCVGGSSTITFTGSGGTAPYTFTYSIDAGTSQTITTKGSDNSIDIPLVNTSSAKTFVYRLISVKDSRNDTATIGTDKTVNVTAPPTANFSFTNDDTCAGTVIQFTSAITGNSPYTYTWDFGDGTTSTLANPTHTYKDTGCATSTHKVTLKVVDKNGCESSIVEKNITVKEKPAISFEDADSPFNPFNNCSSTSDEYSITVNNTSTSACVNSYTINWGDGSSPVTNATFPATHKYSKLGVYPMKISATGNNGCTNTVEYAIKNVNNPAGGLSSPGNTTDLCAPTTDKVFGITGWGENTSDTAYLLSFGDGATETYTQSQLINATYDDPADPSKLLYYYNAVEPSKSLNFPVTHSYTKGSCTVQGGQFIARLTIRNACGETKATVDNIVVLDPSKASFITATNDITCVNKSISFNNTSTIGDNPGCTKSANFTWDFGDKTIITDSRTSSINDQTHTYKAPGTYMVKLSVQSHCGTTNVFTKQICVEPQLMPQFTTNANEGCIPFALTTTNTTNETGTCSTPTYLWTVAYTAANCGNVEGYSFTNGTTKASKSPQFSFTQPGNYKLTLETKNSCGTFKNSQTITVKKPPTTIINPIDNFCGTGDISPMAVIQNCTPSTSGLSYNWIFTGGTPATSNLLDPGKITYTTPGIYNVTLVVTNKCGASNVAAQSFEVLQIPVITNTDLTQAICSNQQTKEIIVTSDNASTTFAWTATATAGISGFTSSGNSNTIPPQTLINAGTTAGAVTYRVTPTLGTCIGNPVDFVITVNPGPSITTEPQSPSNICVGGTLNPLTVAFSGVGTPTYQWFSNSVDTTTGGTEILGETNATFTPLTTAVGTTYYYVEISFATGGCSKITSNTAKITVTPPVTISTPASTESICQGGTPSTMTVAHTGGTGTVSYQWYSNTTNNNTGGSLISNENSNSYTPPALTTIKNYFYYAIVSLSGSGCGDTNSNVFEVKVVADPIISTQPLASQELCQNAIPTDLQVAATGGVSSTYSYQWFSNLNNSATGGTSIPSAKSATFTPPTTAVATTYYYVIVSQSESGCIVTSNTSEVKVNAAPVFTTQPISSEVCLNGATPALTVNYINGVGTPTYQWFSNSVDTTTGGTEILGETNATFTPLTTAVGTTYYYVEISFATGGCSKITSNTAKITVTPPVTISTPTSTESICQGGTPSTMTVAHTGGTGTVSYQWYSNTTNNNTGGSLISNENSNSYTPPALTTIKNYFYYAIVSLSGSGCGDTNSNVFEVKVVADPIISTQPLASQELCQNAIPTDLQVAATGGVSSTYSYQWFSNLNNSATGGTSIPSAKSATFTPPTTAVATTYYYVIVSQSESGCIVTSNTSEVKVNAAPVFTTQPISSEVCLNGATPALTVNYINGVGTPTYQWFSNSVDTTTGGTEILGETNATFTPLTTAVGTTYYYVEISFATGGCSKITSNTAKITVTPPVTISTPTSTESICQGGTPSTMTVAHTGGTGTVSYQWYSNTTNNNTGGSLISNENSNSYTPPALTTIKNYFYYAIVSLSGSGCGDTNSNVFEVKVVADPIISTQPLASQELCQNAIPTDLQVAATGGVSSTYSYQWFSNLNNSATGGTSIPSAKSATFTPPTTAVATTYYYVIVSQSESGCIVTSNTSEVKVNAAPVFTTQPISSEVCLNGATPALTVNYINGVGTPTYQWFSNSVDTTTGGTEILGETNATFTPLTTAVGTTYYYVEISFATGGCSKITSNTAKITVTPPVTISTPTSTESICQGGTPSTMTVAHTGGTGTVSYQWYSNTTNNNTGGSLISNENSNSYTPPALTTIKNYFYYAIVSLSGSGCGDTNSNVFEVKVVADPIISTQPLASQELCQNAIPTDLQVAATGGVSSTYSYQWFSNLNNSATGGTSIPSAKSATFTPPTTAVATTYYYVIVSQSESGCIVTSNTSEVKVNAAPVFTTQPISSEVCLNGATPALTVNYINGVGTPTYQWFSNSVDTTTGGTEILGETNATFTPLTTAVGTTYYYVEISFATGGCSKITSNTAKITVTPPVTISTPTSTESICQGGTPSTMTVAHTGGTGTVSYQWYSNTTNNNTGGSLISNENSNSYTPPALTTIKNYFYYAIVSLSGSGCGDTNSNVFEVKVVADPIISTQPLASQELCQNAIPTDLQVAATGGVSSTYSYQWFSNLNNSATGGTSIPSAKSATFTPPTTAVATTYYYVIVSQSESGCIVTSNTSKVKVNAAPVFTTQPISSEVCLNGATPALTVNYINGVGTPTYQWYRNTTNSTTGSIPIIGAESRSYIPPTNTVGTIYYYVILTFPTGGGCTDVVSNIASIIVNQIPVINAHNITIYSEETFVFDPSTIAGNSVPVGTQYTWTMPIINPAGSISGTSARSVPQNTISQTLTNLGATTATAIYTITPFTSKCIGQDITLNVTINSTINPRAVITNNSCYLSNDASIVINPEGGIPARTGNPYIIQWTGPSGFTSSTGNITNLKVGTYTIRIEDSTGYSVTKKYVVTEPNLLVINQNSLKNISCFQGSDGEIQISVVGGTHPYSYTWTTTDGGGLVQGLANQDLLSAGTYTVLVTDKNNCSTTASYTLTEPTGINIQVAATQNILCYDDATGSIEVTVSGGTPIENTPGVFTYTYNWTGPNGYTSNSQNIGNLKAGKYILQVTDRLGCTLNKEVILTQAPNIDIIITKTDVTCNGKADGSINLDITGGVAPYTILWSNLGKGTTQTNLTAGIYRVVITDNNNCVKNISVTIIEPIFLINPAVKPISCNGQMDGSIDLNITGGVAPFKVTWSDNASAGIQRNNLKPGTYTVNVTDSDTNQCPIQQTFTFTNPIAIAISNTVVDATDCTKVNSGSIDIDVSGGTVPYTYIWNNGATTQDLTDIPMGDYTVVITDANGCQNTNTYKIFRPEELKLEFVESSNLDCTAKTISRIVEGKVTGGFPPYTYSWSAGTISGKDNNIMTTSQNGSYTLTVTDSNGCIVAKTVTVALSTIGGQDFDYTSIGQTQYNFLSINDPITFTNLSTGDITGVTWDFADGSAIITNLNPVYTYDKIGIFTVILTVQYQSGCVLKIEKVLNITKGYTLINPTAFTPNVDGYNDYIRPLHRGFTDIGMKIYDSWGVLLFEEKGLSIKGWNGVIKGLPAENGNYVMIISGTTFYKKQVTTTTTVTLLK